MATYVTNLSILILHISMQEAWQEAEVSFVCA